MTKLVENFPISGDISANDRFMATDKAVTRILILGGGFAGVQVLTKLQHAFENDASIDITLVSSDNFSLLCFPK
jgi:hypothetical protein